jgi:hypothetical protein
VPDEQFAHGALAFPPDLFHQPNDWNDFQAAACVSAESAGCDDTTRPAPASTLAATFTPEFASLRRTVKVELLRYPPTSRLDECGVSGARDAVSLWIANRIVCQVIAAECVRIRDGRSALLAQVRHRIESADCVRAILARIDGRRALVT